MRFYKAGIYDLKENQPSFDNTDPAKRLYIFVTGETVVNTRKNRYEYTRQPWNRFVQCVHTRNDLLAAQNTTPPVEDCVFSIREQTAMMTIPENFRWIDSSLKEFNPLSRFPTKKSSVYIKLPK